MCTLTGELKHSISE